MAKPFKTDKFSWCCKLLIKVQEFILQLKLKMGILPTSGSCYQINLPFKLRSQTYSLEIHMAQSTEHTYKNVWLLPTPATALQLLSTWSPRPNLGSPLLAADAAVTITAGSLSGWIKLLPLCQDTGKLLPVYLVAMQSLRKNFSWQRVYWKLVWESLGNKTSGLSSKFGFG